MNNILVKEKKIKIAFISVSVLTQRYLDYYCLDELSEKFDIEYWDCSDISQMGFHVSDSIIRPYQIKIHTLREFRQNIKRIPRDTVVVLSMLYVKGNYHYLKLLSRYFPKVCVIHVGTFGTPPKEETKVKQSDSSLLDITKKHKSTYALRIVKKILHSLSQIVKFCFIYAMSKKEREKILSDYYYKKCRELFRFYDMWSKENAQYYVNNANVNKYMRYVKNSIDVPNKYIVYIDQFFPYHNELQIADSSWDVEQIAKTHFEKINNLFDVVEKKYKCPVVIAAHPVSNYEKNPYNGREMRKWCTEQLIINSEGVLMHTSGSISYIMLANKPMAIIVNEEYKKSAWGHFIDDLQEQGLYSINIDRILSSKEINIPSIPTEIRTRYMKWIAGGEIDKKLYRDNSELIYENLVKIYHEMYDNNF